MKRKWFICILVLTLLFSFFLTGCSRDQKAKQQEEILESTEELTETDDLIASSDENAENNEEKAETENERFAKVSLNEITLALTKADSRMPWQVQDEWTAQCLMLVCSPLFTLDEDFHLEGVLADSYRCDQQGNYIEIKLKSGIKFHDGSVFDAGDVVYTITQLQTVSNWYSDMVSPILKAEKVNGTTLRLYFQDAGMMNLEDLFFPIIPSGSKSGTMPIGTGPFRLSEEKMDREFKLSANGNYFGQKALLTSIRVLEVPEASLIYDCFESGRISMYTSDVLEWGRYTNDAGKTVCTYGTYEAVTLNFNLQRPFASVFSNRQKVAYAIDAEAVLQDAYYGRGIVTQTPIRPDAWYHPYTSCLYPYDLEKASAMECEGGSTVTIQYDQNDRILSQAALTLQKQLTEAGLTVVLASDSLEGYDILLKRETYMLRDAMNLAGLGGQALASITEEDVLAAAEEADQLISSSLQQYTLFFLNGGVIMNNGLSKGLQPSWGRVFGGCEYLEMNGAE